MRPDALPNFTVATCNLAGGLSDPERDRVIAAGIEQMDADVVVLSDAYDLSGEPSDTEFAAKLGYEIAAVSADPMPDTETPQHLVMLHKEALGIDVSVVKLAGRNALKGVGVWRHTDEAVDIYGVHLDGNSMISRTESAEALVDDIRMKNIGNEARPVPKTLPTIVAGDLQDLNGQALRSMLLGNPVSRYLAHHIPGQQMRKKGVRLAETAAARVTQILKDEANLHDADAYHHPTRTYPPLQLDHILYSWQSMYLSGAVKPTKMYGIKNRAIKAGLQLRTDTVY